MFNPEFFPTPQSLVDRMLDPFLYGEPSKEADIQRRYILDPSAGSGAILDRVRERIRARNHWHARAYDKVYCCETDPQLQATLRGKGYRLVADDFLAYRGDTYFDLILMNPPFSAGDRHVLHAFELVAPGGHVVALVNSETIRNPFTETRQHLARLLDQHGTAEELGPAFRAAERPTDVHVSLLRLRRPAGGSPLHFTFSGATREAEAGPSLTEDSFRDMPATLDIVGNMIAQYGQLKEAFVDYLRAKQRLAFYAQGLLKDARLDILKLAEESIVNQGERGVDNPASYNVFCDATRQQIWRLVLDKVNIQRYMTHAVRQNFGEFARAQGYMDFTKENVAGLVRLVLDNAGTILETAVVAVFDRFTEHHAENRYLVEGWKTNSRWKVNRRVILPWFVERHYRAADGYSARIGTRWEEYEDIDRVMCYLSGRNYDQIVTLRQGIEGPSLNPNPRGVWTRRSEFFDIRCFQKGTAHLTFRDARLWQEFNLRACGGKRWLPAPEQAAYEARRAASSTKAESGDPRRLAA